MLCKMVCSVYQKFYSIDGRNVFPEEFERCRDYWSSLWHGRPRVLVNTLQAILCSPLVDGYEKLDWPNS